MKIVAIRRYEMLVRVKEFGAAHADAFPETSLGGQTFAAVATAVDALQAQLTAQASGAKRDALSQKAAARQALRDAIDAIARTARAIGTDTPGVKDKFALPHSRGDQRLLASARAFAQNAAPLTDQFTTHNMPATFVTDLNNAIAAFERAILGYAIVQENAAAAKKAIAAALEAGEAAVLRLDAIVSNKVDAEALAMWEEARRVSRVGLGSARPASPVAPAPVVPTPAPAPIPMPAPPDTPAAPTSAALTKVAA